MSNQHSDEQASAIDMDRHSLRQRLHEQDVQKIADQVSQRLQPPRRSTSQAIAQDIAHMQTRLKTHHKIIYVSLVFFGVVLVWYGLWTLLGDWALIRQHPTIALVAGILLLTATGQFYKELT